MTQSHLIVKEEGICVYREPEKIDPKKYSINNESDYFNLNKSKWYRKHCEERDAKVKQAQSSAILCEDQERCKFLILEQLGKIGSTWSCHTNAYWQREVAYETIKIGSIYPVPGIEFKEVMVCTNKQGVSGCHNETCWDLEECQAKQTIARLIEHTAEKESPEIDKEQDELLNFLKWFNDGRWYKDMETFNWRRNFAYKDPEILTSEELVKLYRTPVNLKP